MRHSRLILFQNKKAVDILICRNGENPAIFFLELKCHIRSHGRLAIGQKNGGGFQPEILAKAPDYFEKNLRWIIGGEGFDDFIFEPSATIRKFLAGGTVCEKSNNIGTRILEELPRINEAELYDSLETWLCG